MIKRLFMICILLIILPGCSPDNYISQETTPYSIISEKGEPIFLKEKAPQIKEITRFVDEYLSSRYNLKHKIKAEDISTIHSFYSAKLRNNPRFIEFYQGVFDYNNYTELDTKYLRNAEFSKIEINESLNTAEIDFICQVEYINYKKGIVFGFVGAGPEVTLEDDILTQNITLNLIKEEDKWKISQSSLLPDELNPNIENNMSPEEIMISAGVFIGKNLEILDQIIKVLDNQGDSSCGLFLKII